MKFFFRLLIVAFPMIPLTGCSSAYYSTMEKFGYPKREIFVSRLEKARDAQGDAREEFSSALDAFKLTLNVREADLDTKYAELKNSLDTLTQKSNAVKDRIASVEDVSEALFSEWEDEIDTFSNPRFKDESARKLRDTKELYASLLTSMKNAERKLEPAITPFRDNVLFLKHNLNARAIGSLRGELTTMEDNVSSLIRELNRSIADSDKLIAQVDSHNA